MPAPQGNNFWELRSKHGRDRIFKSPEILRKAAIEYFEATSGRKWVKNEVIKGGEMAGDIVHVPTETPFTMQGLCLFLHVNTRYFYDFEKSLEGKKDKKSEGFSQVIRAIRDTVEMQQLEGASVGTFSHHIIARLVGLTDKTEQGFRGKDGQPTDPPSNKTIITNVLPNTGKDL